MGYLVSRPNRYGKDMMNSLCVFEVMSSYSYFETMLLGFDGLLSLV